MTNPYTVILIYPDYIAEQYGEEFWISHVEAEAPAQAVEAAQREALEANPIHTGEVDSHTDFAVVAVFEGHHDDLSHKALA